MIDLEAISIGNATEDIFLFPDEAEVLAPNSTHPFPELCFVHGTKLSASKAVKKVGGNAANVAIALSRLGFKTGTSVFLGGDQVGRDILKTLKEEGVFTNYVYFDKRAESAFSVLLVYDQERTIISYHGSVDFDKQAKKLPKKPIARWIYLSSVAGDWQSVYRKVIANAAEQDVHLALNPGIPQLKVKAAGLKDILSLTDVLFVNREEAIELTELPMMTKTLDLMTELARFGPRVVVVTEGQEGSKAFDGDHFFEASVYPGERIEPTGAGDSFAAGFLGRFLIDYLNLDHQRFSDVVIKEAITWGSINSASVIQEIGPIDGLLTRKEIERRSENRHHFSIRSEPVK